NRVDRPLSQIRLNLICQSPQAREQFSFGKRVQVHFPVVNELSLEPLGIHCGQLLRKSPFGQAARSFQNSPSKVAQRVYLLRAYPLMKAPFQPCVPLRTVQLRIESEE